MQGSLKGKVALVTGGSRGLGARIAETFANEGADVAITYVASADKAEAVADTLRAKGVRALAIRSDQADMAAASPLIDRVVAHFGRLDILVNNAAIAVQGKTVDDRDLDVPNLDRQWQINVMGTVSVTRAAAPVLSDGGRIVFIGSLLGTHVPFAGAADYAGSKAALIGYAKGVARDLGGRNITANVIQPGVMPTDMAADVLGDGVPEALMNLHPIRRIATLEEVAATACFLAGPHAGYITGEVINIAGGLGV
ncbi:SDR family NAD(P)-dependent oxidoreductase [Cupriavidus plantarum]|uniref:NAD(P)-dependent dehydrogenase (Short-subunit alcohol dehydrogenase family) n=1 Tax=Cupriavidus plantarum TaxID=942865 RepID=A0A316EMH4_9BURK|nr:SDR family oxidoreductase [Cupriavidus plantarum]PWK32636.1 NAD(P)-dependent dehydrogenase (short-subunit alcohol dehydrogenase family) [Cupriavidus plantarum]REE90732.1 NAD(P)-dependent dehydrogenase (short-subunit alcohol dehydrogenase family) [Cupriavidus plantarum]CAG2151644.1 Cyclic-di-GMP-binding biofilm dispersal mediator protein [Cupriavidus plantarum]SMR85119.1 NAD(P)-dependent dehydrogenase, short-chain alcohol dehydrogenase family [Cupriavidus plantarum]